MSLTDGRVAAEHTHSGKMIGMGKSYDKTNKASFTTAEDDGPEEGEAEAVPDSEVCMVVLAGDWGLPLLRDIAATTIGPSATYNAEGEDAHGFGGDAKELGDHAQLVRGLPGHHFIPSGMIPVNGEAVVDDLLDHCRHVPLLNPVEKGVYVIANEEALHEFEDWANADDLSGHDYPVENVCGNGARSYDEWKGDVADLRMAIENFGLEGRPIIAIKADVLFHPGYKFNRLVAHAHVVNCDTSAYFELDQANRACYDTGLTAEFSDEGLIEVTVDPKNPAAPRVTACATDVVPTGDLADGAKCLGEFLFLTNATVKRIMDGNVDAQTIPLLASKLANSTGLRAMPFGTGYLSVKRLEGLHYAESFCASYMQKYNQIHKLMTERMTTDSNVHFGEFNETQQSRKAVTAELQAREENFKAEFDHSYFGDRAVRIGTKINMTIPTQFYHSEYGRTYGRVGHRAQFI